MNYLCIVWIPYCIFSDAWKWYFNPDLGQLSFKKKVKKMQCRLRLCTFFMIYEPCLKRHNVVKLILKLHSNCWLIFLISGPPFQLSYLMNSIDTYTNMARYNLIDTKYHQMVFRSPSDGTPIISNQPSFGNPGQTKVSGDRQRETTHVCCLAAE